MSDTVTPEFYEALKADEALERVLEDIGHERAAQDARWGEQNHPDLAVEDQRYWYGKKAENFKLENERLVAEGRLGWDMILQEELFDALAEKDPAKLREELVQVAAVAACWIQAIDRRTA